MLRFHTGALDAAGLVIALHRQAGQAALGESTYVDEDNWSQLNYRISELAG